jgi:hypothetical protein
MASKLLALSLLRQPNEEKYFIQQLVSPLNVPHESVNAVQYSWR